MTKVKEMMKKMVVLGDRAVGKTSLIRRFVLDRFDDDYISTIGAKTTAKSMQISMGREMIDLKLQVWDILGQKGYNKLHNSSFRGMQGVFMVADITRKDTMKSLENYWIPKVHHLAGKIPIVILANKSDLTNDVEFTRDELKEFASRYKAPFYLTSAKNGQNVKQAFHMLGKRMIALKNVETPKVDSPTVIHPRLLYAGEKGEITRIIDRIIDDFCKEYNSLEDAMPVLRRQFELAKLDLNNPTVEALKRAIDRLAVVEMSIKKKKVVEADYDKRQKWVEEIE